MELKVFDRLIMIIVPKELQALSIVVLRLSSI
jgi:hypothetical protein